MKLKPSEKSGELITTQQDKRNRITLFNLSCILFVQVAVKVQLIICILGNINIFNLLGQEAPSWWTWCTTNKLYSCIMIFFLCNAIEGQLVSTGAFEISLNGKESYDGTKILVFLLAFQQLLLLIQACFVVIVIVIIIIRIVLDLRFSWQWLWRVWSYGAVSELHVLINKRPHSSLSLLLDY